MFHSTQIQKLFDMIISNRLGNNSVYIKTNKEIKELIYLLKECELIVPNMSNFIRFILINLYSTHQSNDLFTTQMLFHKHGEIPLYMYLTNILDKSKIDINLYVCGLMENDEDTYQLELYYISYEKTHNSINFVNKF